jgi:phage host-nuclease inhibitor protein Gam
MARYKPSPKKLESLEDVDDTLREIGLLEREIESLDAEAQKRIGDIKREAAEQGEPHRKRIAELSAKVGAFAEYNKGELFKDRKSIELSFGVFGFRKTTSIHVKKTTIDLLRRIGMTDCIRVKEEADKERLSDLDDEVLSSVDAIRKSSDTFFCEPNREEINKELLRAAI